MKLWSILGNSQKLDGGAMFGNAPRAMWAKWSPPDEQNRIELACRALLASPLAGKTVLFEAGIGAFFEPKLRERYGVVEDQHVLRASRWRRRASRRKTSTWWCCRTCTSTTPAACSRPGRKARRRSCCSRTRPMSSAASTTSARCIRIRATAPASSRNCRGCSRPPAGSNWSMASIRARSAHTVRFHYSDGHTPGLMLAEIVGPDQVDGETHGGVVFCADLIPGRPWVHVPITMGYDRNAELLIDEKKAFLADKLRAQRASVLHPRSAVRAGAGDAGRQGQVRHDPRGRRTAGEGAGRMMRRVATAWLSLACALRDGRGVGAAGGRRRFAGSAETGQACCRTVISASARAASASIARSRCTSGGPTATVTRRCGIRLRSIRRHFAPGHANPPKLPLDNRRWWSDDATLEGKPIDLAVLQTLGQWRVFRPNFSRLPANLAASFQPEGDGLGSAENPLDPQIGDLRITWRELSLPPLEGKVELRGDRWVLSPEAAAQALSAERASTVVELPPGTDQRLLPWLLAAAVPAGRGAGLAAPATTRLTDCGDPGCAALTGLPGARARERAPGIGADPSAVVARAEDLVAGVAQARQDVADVVEAVVDRGGEDLHVRMPAFEHAQAFRRGHQEQALDALAAGGLEHVDGGDQGAAGGQHRVEDDRGAFVHATGELLVVADRFERPLVALQSDHADLGGGNQLEHARQHAQAGAQDRHQRHLGALDAMRLDRPGPAVDRDFLGLQVGGGFVGQQGRDLGGEFAEFLGADPGDAHQAELVLHQRVADFDDLHRASLAQPGAPGMYRPLSPGPTRFPFASTADYRGDRQGSPQEPQ